MSDVTMPQLGETVTEGTITRWAKAVGEKVEQDEVLFEVSTDKVDSEVPSPTSGYIAEILVPEGETVDVGTRLAVISDQPAAGGSAAAPSAEAAPAAAPAPEPAASAPAAATGPPPAPASPAEEGANGAVGDRVLSPVVRRLLSEHQLDASQIEGTGVGGRITRSDVLDAVDRLGRSSAAPTATPSAAAVAVPAAPPASSREPASAPAASAPAGAPAAPAAAPRSAVVGAEGDDEVVPFTNIRRRTAEHMVRSKATSAHTFTVIEVDFNAIDIVRRQVQESFRASEGFGISYLPFIARAVIDAIGDYPRVNASVGDDQLIIHRRVHLGVAVDLDLEGLIVPVIKDADSKRLRAIAREVRDLAERARSRRLSADEIAGGTFTITNPGPFGTLMTVPIINQPQVAILSTDGIKRKPVVAELADGGEGIVIHPVGLLGLSYDHRAIDGAYASAFLARCREYLETRDWAQEL